MWGRGYGALGSLCVLAWLLVLGACGRTHHEVRVSTLRDPSKVGRTYWLRPGAEGLQPGQLEYRRFAALVHKALAARGYQRVDERTEPHLVVLLGYGVGPPQTQVSRKTAVVSRTTTKTTYNALRSSLLGGYGLGGYTTSKKRTFWAVPLVEVKTQYTSWVTLSAVDGPAFVASQPIREVWNTSAIMESEGRDLQVLFPVMLASAMDYIGVHTGREVRVDVPLRSQRVEWLIGAR